MNAKEATAVSSHCNVYRFNQICNNFGSNLGILGFNLEKSFNKRLDNAVSSNETKKMG